MTASAFGVGGVDGDVETGVAHGVVGGREPSAVAEFGPNGHGGDGADAVAGAQGAASGLVAPRAAIRSRNGSLAAVMASIMCKATSTASAPAGDSSAAFRRTRPLLLSRPDWGAVPWWNSWAWMRWIQPVRSSTSDL
jgi:hypothetical protein